MYTMVEVSEKDWPLLPPVDDPWESALVSNEVAEKLRNGGYIPGRIHPTDADPQVRQSSGWSATGKVVGWTASLLRSSTVENGAGARGRGTMARQGPAA